MRDRDKTKQQLIIELNEIRQQVTRLEEFEEERKRLVEELRESEEMSLAVANATPDFMAILDRDMVIRAINRPMAQRFGKRREELAGTHGLDLLPPELALSRKQYFDEVLQTGQVCRWEDENQGVYFDNIAYPIREENGQVTRLVIIARDITERKQVEEQLRESERYLKKVQQIAHFGSWVLDVEANRVELSDEMFNILGITEEQFDGTPEYTRNLVMPEDRARVQECYDDLLIRHQPASMEYSIMRPDGSIRHLWGSGEIESYQEGKSERIIGIVLDITERKQVEEALRQSEEKFRLLTEKSVVGIYIIQDSKIAYVNPSLAGTFGYEPEEMIGSMTPADVIHPDDIGVVMERLGERFEGIVEDRTNIYRGIRKDGSIIYIEVYTILTDYQSKPAVMGTLMDVTERTRVEEALRQSEERYRNIVEMSPDGIVTMNVYGIVTSCNAAFVNLTGYPESEILGKHIAEIPVVRPSDIPVVAELFTTLLTVDRPGAVEWQWTRKDGTQKVGEFHMGLVEEDGVTSGFQIVVRDVTGRKRAEQERLRIERLESLGTLAGGIAHDFNNLLTGIMGNISLAQGRVDPESKAAERLLEAEGAALRARDLTQHLLTFARGGGPVKETTDIGRLVSDSANFALRGSNSRCIIDIPESLWQANVDKGQVNEVISNLVINADEAMPEGGTIKISVRNRIFREENPLSLPKGDYIEISIEDHGVGIPEDNLPRIFEPYFTTKERGSGLGLATTYSIIQNHKGYVTVDSIPETGTTFRVCLPAMRRSSIVFKETEDVQALCTGKILIMDDEEAIRRILQQALSEVGHTVVAAADGADAIEQFVRAREQEQPFDVVILDLTVPGAMGGVEALKRLLEIDPNVKAIVSSGYSTDPIMADYKKYGFSAVIVKPYRVRELRTLISNVLQEKHS